MDILAWAVIITLVGLLFKLWGLVYIAGFVAAVCLLRVIFIGVKDLLQKEEPANKRRPRQIGQLTGGIERRKKTAGRR